MCRLTLPISPTCLLKMDGSDRLRGFHHKETRSLVLRFRDLPNPDVPMALSFSGLFPCPRIDATRPLKMDGPRRFASSRLATPNFSDNLKPRLPKRRRFPRCPPRVRTNGRLRSYRYFVNRDFASLELLLRRSFKTANSDMPI
jgi:hypothetical protein